MPKLIVFLCLLGGPLLGQCIPGAISPNNTQINCVLQAFVDGSSNVTDLCYANALQPVTTFYKSSSTLTSIQVTSNVATITFSSTSFLWPGATVVVAGSTTAALNGSWKITTVSTTTATFAVTTANVTVSNAALTVSTQSPLLNATVWAIQKLTYSGTILTGTYWAGGLSSVVPHGLACSARANY